MTDTADKFLRPAISNGNPHEQALIRRWWVEQCQSQGELVWEYHLAGYYIDAVWFKNSASNGVEHPGRNTNEMFPIDGQRIVVCESKLKLTPELVGQALVYSQLARRAGATVDATVLLCTASNPTIKSVACELGLDVIEYQRSG